MAEKPIIFSNEMVRAILDGRKTQTRRVVNPQPELDNDGMWHWKDCQWMDGGLGFPLSGIEDHSLYKPGDALWVREAFCPQYFDDGSPAYRADYHKEKIGDVVPEPKWKPSIHMPRTAARIFLRVTDVRVERVQEINVYDIFSEGAAPVSDINADYKDLLDRYWIPLWDSINAKRGYGWDVNPWVWVYDFERIDTP